MKIYIENTITEIEFIVDAPTTAEAILKLWRVFLDDLMGLTPRELRYVGNTFELAYFVHEGDPEQGDCISSVEAYLQLSSTEATFVHELISRHNTERSLEKFFGKVLSRIEQWEVGENE